MNKNVHRQYSARFVIWLVLVMLMVLLLPASALARPTEGVSQKTTIYGAWNKWYLHDPIPTPDETTINIGEQDMIDFDVEAPHEMQVYGEIWLAGVTEFVYIDSINVHLEYEETPGNWIPYVGRDGNDVIVPVVNERTQETYFKIDA
ncbi:hypothetical protein [Phosphitispora sp. TUW77]|uniref:hypothetical protein n=1 Tax=Phosphitispora sp. TUW77 TaxID=3152361 RepID=UPI003AB61A97